MLTKTYKRFAKDERIVMVDSIDDIPRLGTVPDMHGVLCPYNLAKDHVQEILDFMKTCRIDTVLGERSSDYYKKIHGAAMPECLTQTFHDLKDMFHRGSNMIGRDRVRLRANSTLPTEPHNHPDVTLTYTFTDMGTVGVNTRGEQYNVPQNYGFIFGEEIWHMAKQTFPPDHPKLTIMVD